MTTTGLVILIVLVFVGALIYMALAGMPGKTARKRGHPQADAINVLGWLGLLLGIAPWLVAMVWAHMNPINPAGNTAPEDFGTDDD